MVFLLNRYFLSASLLSLLFLFFTFSLFIIILVVSVNDYNSINSNEFFGISPDDYYDSNDYLEESSPLPERLDQETITKTTIDNDQNNTLQSTFSNYEKLAEATTTTTTTTNYLSENYSDDDDINFIAAGDWSCNKETEKTIKKLPS